MSESAWVRPQLTVLATEQKEQVHRYSLRLLAEVGLRVDSERARQVFSTGKAVKVSGDRVAILPDAIDRALETAPHRIDVYNRHGEHAFRLGDGPARFGIGVTNLYYQEPADEMLTPFGRAHMAAGTRLGEVLPAYDCVSTLGILQDIAPGTEDVIGVLEMAANTVKPLVLLISDEGQFVPALDLLAELCGELAARPFAIPYLNPVTPLIINRETGDKLIAAVERGLPVIYSNYSLAGATTPITPAGMLALLNAELLAGLVLSQLVRPGAPVILGSLPAFFDMKAMLDFYDPQTVLLNAACAEMMAYYGIPHAGTSGSGLGSAADLPSAGLHWLNHLTACIGQTGLAPFVGGSLNSKAFSPTAVVLANDIILQARAFAAGFALDDASAVLDEIAAAGPGGSFLGARSTRKRFRDAYYTSSVFPRLSMEKWADLGRPQAAERLKAYTLDLIASARPPADHDDIVARGEAYLHR